MKSIYSNNCNIVAFSPAIHVNSLGASRQLSFPTVLIPPANNTVSIQTKNLHFYFLQGLINLTLVQMIKSGFDISGKSALSFDNIYLKTELQSKAKTQKLAFIFVFRH